MSGNEGENDKSDEYGDIHKLVLQGIMSAGYLDAKGVKRLFIGACKFLKLEEEERTSMAYVQKVVLEINHKIKPFDMSIKSASCELTCKKYFIFLLTVEKPILKFQNYFSKFEVEMFQKLMDMILRKYRNFAVHWSQAFKLVREVDSRASNTQGEEFIEKMINHLYFAKYELSKSDDPDDDYDYEITLGIRTIKEFEPILGDLYDDVMKKCSLCNNLLLHGYRCPKCPILIHRPCYSRYIQGSKICPNATEHCKASWTREKDMVRRVRTAAEESELYQNSPETESSLSRLEERWREEVDDDDGDDEAEPGDPEDIPMPILEPEPPQLRPAQKKSPLKEIGGTRMGMKGIGSASRRRRRVKEIDSNSD